MTQKEAMRKVVEFMNNQMPEYGLRPDMITGKPLPLSRQTTRTEQ